MSLRGFAAVAAFAALAAPASAASGPLARRAPVVIHAADEPAPLTSVQAFAGQVPGVRPGPAVPTLYGRREGEWLQYWMLFADNPQDRGLLRTGRHEGDWEMVQYRLRRGRIVQGVYAQHSGAEACGTRGLRIRPSGRPVGLAVASRGVQCAREPPKRTSTPSSSAALYPAPPGTAWAARS